MNVPRNISSFASLVLIVSFLLAPMGSVALAGATIIDLPTGYTSAINRAQQAVTAASAAETVEAVPTAKPVSEKASGFLDGIAISIARVLVQQMVNSTIGWINGSDVHNGGPAYATDKQSYLGGIANAAVNAFIATDPSLNFLCSPFKAQIKLTLVQNYAHQYQPQCTLEQIGVNLDNFYQSFSSGGWYAWEAVTQNDENNPYGSYFIVKNEFDSRLATALGIANDDLKINDGFLSTKDCLAHNPSDEILKRINEDLRGGANEADEIDLYGLFDRNKKGGECIQEGPVKTPGKVIADLVNKQVGVGQEELLSAQNVDDLLNAVLVKLVSKTVISADGLFNKNPYHENNDPNLEGGAPAPTVSCSPNVINTKIGNLVAWSYTPSIPASSSVSYHWLFDADAALVNSNNTDLTVGVKYTTNGIKNAKVRVTTQSGDNDILCNTSVVVADISCSANVGTVATGKPVKWTVEAGSFPVLNYQWSGTELPASATVKSPNLQSITVQYQNKGNKSASVTLYNAGGLSTSVNCPQFVTVVDKSQLAVSCFPMAGETTAKVGDTVHWQATIAGGSGSFKTIQFGGGEEYAPWPANDPQRIQNPIWPTPSAQTLTNINSANANLLSVPVWHIPTTGTLPWNYRDSSGQIYVSTIGFAGNDTATSIEVARRYFTATSSPYGAVLSVVDNDPAVAPVTQACSGGIKINP